MVQKSYTQLSLMTLLEAPAPEQRPGARDEVRALVSRAVRESGKTRDEIAAEMTRQTGDHLTKSMLDAWTADSRRYHRMPLEYAPALERVTGTRYLSEWFVKRMGGEVYWGEEALKARLGVLEMEKQRLSGQTKALKRHMEKR